MCIFHEYKYIGAVHTWFWLGGVSGGIRSFRIINAKQCIGCGKIKEVE